MALAVTYPRTASYNDTVRVSASFTDSTGAAQDPSVVTFSYQPQATGTNTTLTYGTDVALVKDSTGHYHVDLTVTTAGLWNFNYIATGTGADSQQGYFYVQPNPLGGSVSPPTTIDLTASDGSTHIGYSASGGITRTVQDKLREIIDAADYSGGDLGIKIAAAHSALPSAGGVIDARSLTGTQAIGSALTITKPCVILLPNGTINVSAAITVFASGSQIRSFQLIGQGPWSTSLNWTGSTSGTMLTIKRVGRYEVSGLRLVNGVAAGTTTGMLINSEDAASSETGPGIHRSIFVSGFNTGVQIGQGAGGSPANGSASELVFDTLELNSNANGCVVDGNQTLNIQFRNINLASNTTAGVDVKNGGEISFVGGSCSDDAIDFILRTGSTQFTVQNIRSEQIRSSGYFVQAINSTTGITTVSIRDCEARAASGTPALVVSTGTGPITWEIHSSKIDGSIAPGAPCNSFTMVGTGVSASGANGHPFTDDNETSMRFASIGNYLLTGGGVYTLSTPFNHTFGCITTGTPTDLISIRSTDIRFGGNVQNGGRFQLSKGGNVSSANDLTLGSDGNVFHVTGNTTINAIIATNWQSGSEITLIFDSNPTVKNNTAGGGGTAKMLLSGSVDMSATANDTLTLVYDGTSWFEKCRTVI